ncbi:cbb3-type cytochrome oxidase subunit 3 [Halomonas cupida]|uniref:Cytochrome C oxidase cbb3-type subunit CcoQ n=1 Tax=Halomonas cupida TaxID=44933 RepID=A0A1M7HFK2_9GAMM|nr:cytochrome C oxidase cbb3-type subunit CcoQ [Halomonas cupida]SHM27220.1 cytochrome c oxidase cbb3-type subunit 4 [Halomonas cupida]
MNFTIMNFAIIDMGTLRGLITGILLSAFLGLVAWAWSKRRKADFDEAAHLPFADDESVAEGANETQSRSNRGESNL